LREIDAFLLQYYEKKSRRKDLKQKGKTVDAMEKSHSGKVQPQGLASDNLNKSKVSAGNDKNISTA
jgi:hypothetical protein